MTDLGLRASDYENAPTEKGAFYAWERELLERRRSEADAEIAERERPLFGGGDSPSHFTNREIHRRAVEARETTLRELAAGLGLDLAFVRAKANVGRERLDAAHARESARIADSAKERQK